VTWASPGREFVLSMDSSSISTSSFVSAWSVGPNTIVWVYSGTSQEIARGLVSANMVDECEGWFRIQIEDFDQRIILVPRPRHFGGWQWYFMCGVMNRRASILWMPPNAGRFLSHAAFDGKVAYASQFLDPVNRAHRGKEKIKAVLIGNQDPDQWDSAQPKWMR
jgi:hypothetical protein